MEKSLSLKLDSLIESYGIDPEAVVDVVVNEEDKRLVITWKTDG